MIFNGETGAAVVLNGEMQASITRDGEMGVFSGVYPLVTFEWDDERHAFELVAYPEGNVLLDAINAGKDVFCEMYEDGALYATLRMVDYVETDDVYKVHTFYQRCAQ